MKLINKRLSAFETNSSSSHSLVIPVDYKETKLDIGNFDGTIIIRRFDWEDRILNNPIDKFSYVLSSKFPIDDWDINEIYKLENDIKVLQLRKFVLEFLELVEKRFEKSLKPLYTTYNFYDICLANAESNELTRHNVSSGIDHESVGTLYRNNLDEDLKEIDKIFNIVFNPSIAILTSNDNGGIIYSFMSDLIEEEFGDDSYLISNDEYLNKKTTKELEELLLRLDESIKADNN